MSLGIPMSGAELLDKEVNGVTYHFKQPIGKVEREIKKIQQSVFNLSPHMGPAIEQFDKAHKGKKLKEGQRIEGVLKIAQKLAEDAYLKKMNIGENDRVAREIFDLVCAGWDGSPFDFKDIPEGNVPSDHMESEVVTELVEWYQEATTLSGDDRKN